MVAEGQEGGHCKSPDRLRDREGRDERKGQLWIQMSM